MSDTFSSEDLEQDLTQNITFYNRPEEDGSIGNERLAVTVSPHGDWKLYKMRPGVPLLKSLGKSVGESWVRLAFPKEMIPLPIPTRRTIAYNVFQCRKNSKESATARLMREKEAEHLKMQEREGNKNG